MKVLFVDTIAQTSALTEEQGHPYVVRTNTNSTIIGRTAALAAAKGPWKSFYFIGPDYEWGHVVNNDFWEFIQRKKQGVSKVGDLWPKLGERDFSSHITTILNAKPDAVFSSLWGGDLIAFIRAARRMASLTRSSSSPRGPETGHPQAAGRGNAGRDHGHLLLRL